MATQNLTIPEEIWKDIPEFPGYQVSDHGRIRTFWRQSVISWRGGSKYVLDEEPQRIIKTSPDKDGYQTVTLKHKRRRVHRLVLLAFVGPCPPGCEACHNDGNLGHNFLENLRWDTSKANSQDSIRHGTNPGFLRKGKGKVSAEQVLEIREIYPQGHYSMKNLGKIYGVCAQTIHSIVHGKHWKHI